MERTLACYEDLLNTSLGLSLVVWYTNAFPFPKWCRIKWIYEVTPNMFWNRDLPFAEEIYVYIAKNNLRNRNTHVSTVFHIKEHTTLQEQCCCTGNMLGKRNKQSDSTCLTSWCISWPLGMNTGGAFWSQQRNETSRWKGPWDSCRKLEAPN